MSRSTPTLNSHQFNIIYADPPWRYRTWTMNAQARPGDSQMRGRRPPYDCMDSDAICRLPVSEICANDCLLFLWATYPMLPAAFKVIDAWGFSYRTVAFTWVKSLRRSDGFHVGLGHWTRANPESCL